jgi:hypothetical protein
MGGEKVDSFVSHAGADRAWAEWVAWQLADAKATLANERQAYQDPYDVYAHRIPVI